MPRESLPLPSDRLYRKPSLIANGSERTAAASTAEGGAASTLGRDGATKAEGAADWVPTSAPLQTPLVPSLLPPPSAATAPFMALAHDASVE